MTTFVALDLETTGLDPHADEIIEIGVVRFTAQRQEDEFTTLVRPRGHISGFITRLTGINDAMVQNAPTIDAVLDTLESFIGDAIIVGHNIRFDLDFLAAAGLALATNEVVDTYEMASVLLPRASRYGLGALGHALNIPFPATHRALDDARVNHHLYLHLADMIASLPLGLVAKIVEMGISANWDGTWPFQQSLEARQRQGERASQRGLILRPTTPAPPTANTLPDAESGAPLNADAVAAFLEPDGALAQHMPRFEHREQQVTMARAVADALSHSKHLIVEAGTGTGKSIAYLLPAALYALQNNTRIVVSTNTKNLQEQLLHQDIPTVRQVLPQALRAAVLKGRGNYLCPHRFARLLEDHIQRPEEVRVLGKVLVWLQQGGNGDRAEINLNGPVEQSIWQRISADAPQCTAEHCLRVSKGDCPFQRARRAAEQAHILVVNHALLLSDVITHNSVLPEYRHLIVDEAHHLEGAATQALSFEVTRGSLLRLLNDLGDEHSGFLGKLFALGKRTRHRHRVSALISAAASEIVVVQEAIKDTFAVLADFLEDQREGQPLTQYPQQVSLTPAMRLTPSWEAVMISWEDAENAVFRLLDALKPLRPAAEEFTGPEAEQALNILGEIDNLRMLLVEATTRLHALILEPTPAMIYWVQIKPRYRSISLHAAPLDIGNALQEHIWHTKETVVLTSATLTTGGEMDYIRQRLAAEHAEELILDSPFDYKRAALLYVVNDIPEPNRPGYQQAVEDGLVSLARATRGRMMALFTSYAQLKRTASAIRPALLEAGLAVYEQGSGAAPQALLDEFRTSDGAVLLGTRAFWEGVDIPGEALSALVIVKLPFAVPSDPIVAARAAMFDNPFNEYHLPEAALTFRQGFGRLIRTRTDRGIVAVFDRRLLTRRYGQFFLDSLPPCTRHQGPMHRLPVVASRWLNDAATSPSLLPR